MSGGGDGRRLSLVGPPRGVTTLGSTNVSRLRRQGAHPGGHVRKEGARIRRVGHTAEREET